MQIYNFHPGTGEYLGSGIARPDPLEDGRFLIPAHAAEVAPLEPGQGQAVVWTGEGWDLVEDHRGEVHYSTATGEPLIIEELGALPAGLTGTAPGDFQNWDAAAGAWADDVQALTALYATALRAERDRRVREVYDAAVMQLLRERRRAVAAGADLTAIDALIAEWDVFVDELCSLPEQSGFPWQGPNDLAVPWPEPPATRTA
ncbi:MAG: phage tail assembly chaperone [Proteobacteria bacterium]|nr:phage tail assembly chaperone [Pseudomonadota bacterium]